MKIVFLAPFGIRPKGTVIARMLPLAVELQKIGHSVTIIAPPYTNPEDSGKTEVLRGVRLVNVVLPATGKSLAVLPLSWRMFRAALTEKPDLVHLFKPKGYGGLAAMLLLFLQRLSVGMPPLFVDTDDWEGKGGMNELQAYSTAEKRLFAFQEEWLSRHASGMSVASRELERLTKSLGVPTERILYLPNCVEETLPGNGLLIRGKLAISSETPLLLLYTRFFEFSQDRLHRVLGAIHQRLPGVRFLVVGKGRQGEEAQLLEASRRLGFAESLIMVGWVEPGGIADYLAAADVAIYPLDNTLVNRAKCPAKLTEIIRAGIPVVADGIGQAAEYIEHGVSGILCNPDDPERMAAEVESLLRNADLRKKLGAEGSKRLTANFNWHDAAIALDTFYRSIP